MGAFHKPRPALGSSRQVRRRGLATVRRRSPRRCQGNGPAPDEAQPASVWTSLPTQPAELEPEDLSTQPLSGMGPHAGARHLLVLGTVCATPA